MQYVLVCKQMKVRLHVCVCKAEVEAAAGVPPPPSSIHYAILVLMFAATSHTQHRSNINDLPRSPDNAHTAPQAASSALTWTPRSCAGGRRATRPSRGVYPSF